MAKRLTRERSGVATMFVVLATAPTSFASGSPRTDDPPPGLPCRFEIVHSALVPSGWCNPTIGGFARAFNEHDEIVGYVACLGGDRAYRWSPEDGFELVPLPDGATSSRALGINAAGTIVGTYWAPGVPGPEWAFRHRDGVTDVIGVAPGGFNHSDAVGVDELERVVGNIGGQPSHQAFAWNDGTFSLLGEYLPHAAAFAGGVTADGRVFGHWHDGGLFAYRGFVHDIDTHKTIDILPPEGLHSIEAHGLNGHGHVVGRAFVAPVPPFIKRVFLWDGADVSVLDVPGDAVEAYGISDDGLVIGIAAIGAFVWRDNEYARLADLVDTPDWMHFAQQVDARSRILAQGAPAQGTGQLLYILEPVWRPWGDLDSDCAVSSSDLLLLLAHWNDSYRPGDYDGDGLVGFGDLLILLANWSI